MYLKNGTYNGYVQTFSKLQKFAKRSKTTPLVMSKKLKATLAVLLILLITFGLIVLILPNLIIFMTGLGPLIFFVFLYVFGLVRLYKYIAKEEEEDFV